MVNKWLTVLAGGLMLCTVLFAQSSAPYFSFNSGLGFAKPDSAWSVNFRFRMQNRFLFNTVSDEDLSIDSWEMRTRRMRLAFTGHAFNPKFTYYVQLSFSRGDMDWDMNEPSKINTSPNVVRDAVLYYKPCKSLQLGLGQTKLPGNRQRVVSSGSLQFYDRSPLNGAFTPDRDFGLFSTWTGEIGEQVVLWKSAVSSGEGRNSVISNSGLAYTTRVEWLPFGKFSEGGDYFEGDVVREEKPKVSLAGGYMLNDLAMRTGGQLGKDLYAPKSFQLLMADVLVKYHGWALSSEFMKRSCESPVTRSGTSNRVIQTGSGINTQLSYCFKNRMEIAGRYTYVSPDASTDRYYNQINEAGIGVTKYLMKHKVKLQGNLFYHMERNLFTRTDGKRNFFGVFQVEFGI